MHLAARGHHTTAAAPDMISLGYSLAYPVELRMGCIILSSLQCS